MDLYEYQARDLFERHGIPVLRGITATTPEQAGEAAAQLGTDVVVVKAQVKTGGRGKAGGVNLFFTPAGAGRGAATGRFGGGMRWCDDDGQGRRRVSRRAPPC